MASFLLTVGRPVLNTVLLGATPLPDIESYMEWDDALICSAMVQKAINREKSYSGKPLVPNHQINSI